MDDLQRELAELAETNAPFGQIKKVACQRLGAEPWPDEPRPHVHSPGLTEDWFC